MYVCMYVWRHPRIRHRVAELWPKPDQIAPGGLPQRHRQHACRQVREALCVREEIADALDAEGAVLPPAAPPLALARLRVVTGHQYRQDAAD